MKVLCIKDFEPGFKVGVWYEAKYYPSSVNPKEIKVKNFYNKDFDGLSKPYWKIYSHPRILVPDYFYPGDLDHIFCFEKYFITLEDYRDGILNDLI